jgi:hypothetical protein
MRSLRVARRLRTSLALTLALSFGSGCGATLVDVWKDTQVTAPPLENVLILVVKKEDVRRRIMEDAFVSAITSRGLKATPSYRLFPALPDSSQMAEAVRANGYDGVIVASKLPTRTDSTFVNSYTTREARTHYVLLTHSYQTYYAEVEHPGYAETERTVRHRIDVWSARDGGHLWWSGEGQNVDPESSDVISHEIVRTVVPELVKEGVLAKHGS